MAHFLHLFSACGVMLSRLHKALYKPSGMGVIPHCWYMCGVWYACENNFKCMDGANDMGLSYAFRRESAKVRNMHNLKQLLSE